MRPSHFATILLVTSWLLPTSALPAAELKEVAYLRGDETVHALWFAPSRKGPFPDLLAIHAVFGLDEWTKEQASKLAHAGYLVLALDFCQSKVDGANHGDDEAAIRKLIADHNAAFDRHDGSAIVYFTDDADTRNVVGKFFTGKAEIEKLDVVLNKQWANVQRTETIERIRFLTPNIALVDSVVDATGYVVTENGMRLPPPAKVISSKVVTKKEDRWLITAMRIAIPAGPAPSSSASGTGTRNLRAQDAPTAPDDTNHASDEAAIRKMVADVQDAWNRRDPQGGAAAAHLTKDYDHINVGGNWGSGKDQAEKNVNDFFATRGSTVPTVAQSIEKLRFITPDVAICVVRNRYSNDKRTWEAMSAWVLHKMNGEWWNEAFQNTLIQSREEAIAQAARASSPLAQTEPEVLTPANSRTDFSGDVAAIRKIVAAGTDAWNRRDSKALTAALTEDSDHIGSNGGWTSGRPEIERIRGVAHVNTSENLTSSLAKIRFVTSDVAVVVVWRQYQENENENRKGISTLVFHKMNGEWLIEAFQNTYVRPTESHPR
jgi:uncharacterized protein (TIGR02246 family)